MTLTAEQHAARAGKIGGSDVAAILGLSPYVQPYHVWLDKTGRLDELQRALGQDPGDENEAQRWGSLLEDTIAQRWSERFEKKLRRVNLSVSHDKYPWLVGHLDRDVVGEPALLEIKNVGWRLGRDWGPDSSDEVADYYVPQPHTYMLLRDNSHAYVAALIGGSELRHYHLERSAEWDELIVDMTGEFYREHILNDQPPPFEFDHRSTSRLLKALYRSVEDEEVSLVDLDGAALSWAEVWEDAKAKAREYQKVADVARNHLLATLGNAAKGVLPDQRYLERKLVKRGGYTVEATEYIDFRVKKTRAK